MDLMVAATHADPYDYYRTLAARGDLYRDTTSHLWIATTWQIMEAILASPLCHTRPLSEPIPAAIVDGPAGGIFRGLVRMIDGPRHCPLKSAIAGSIDVIPVEHLTQIIDERLAALDRIFAPGASGLALTRFIYSVPVQIIARLLGVPEAQLADVTQWIDQLTVAFTPVAAPADVLAGHDAADRLLDLFGHLVRERKAGLLASLAAEAERRGHGREAIIANGIGFLTQTFEGTAGLIGNTLIALARHADARSAVLLEPHLVHEAVLETLRHDPPAQSTRRFVAADGVVAGAAMRQGDAILLLLGAPGRDPAFNPDPDRFDIDRKHRQIVNFGAGAHACPADGIATAIAGRAVHYLLSRADFAGLLKDIRYRRSFSVRAPIFGA